MGLGSKLAAGGATFADAQNLLQNGHQVPGGHGQPAGYPTPSAPPAGYPSGPGGMPAGVGMIGGPPGQGGPYGRPPGPGMGAPVGEQSWSQLSPSRLIWVETEGLEKEYLEHHL